MTRKAILCRIVFALAYGVLAIISMRQRDAVTLSTLYWPPAGLLLAALMLAPVPRWPAWMALAAGLHIAAGMIVAHRSWQIAATFAVADLILCAVTAALWRWVTGSRRTLARLSDLVWFIALLAANSILGGWLVLLGLQAVAPSIPAAHWYIWSLAAFVGCLIAAPLVLAWSGFRFKRPDEYDLLGLWLGLLCAFALLAGTTIAFDNPLSSWLWNLDNPFDLSYGPLVFLALVAVTWGQAGASLTVAGLALIAGSYTASGMGPYGHEGNFADQSLLAVQGYLGAAALLSLFMGALNADRERAMQEAMTWKSQLQTTLAATGRLAWKYDATDNAIEWTGDLSSLLGPDPAQAESLEAWLARIHAGDQDKVRAWMKADDALHTRRPVQFLLRGAGARYRPMEMTGAAVLDAGERAGSLAGLLRPLPEDDYALATAAHPD